VLFFCIFCCVEWIMHDMHTQMHTDLHAKHLDVSHLAKPKWLREILKCSIIKLYYTPYKLEDRHLNLILIKHK
jgi:hypothetical protein